MPSDSPPGRSPGRPPGAHQSVPTENRLHRSRHAATWSGWLAVCAGALYIVVQSAMHLANGLNADPVIVRWLVSSDTVASILLLLTLVHAWRCHAHAMRLYRQFVDARLAPRR